MRILFFIITLLHALIHLLGFIKAFDIREIKELQLPISKGTGVLWLSAGATLTAFAFLYLFRSSYACYAGIAAALFSQILIVMYWKDAKFGTIPNVIILAVSFTLLGAQRMHHTFSEHVKTDFRENNSGSASILTAENILHLPLPVQKYLYYTRSVGQALIHNMKAELSGGMRSAENDPFMPFNSVQYNFFMHPSRYFYMSAKKAGIPATGLHIYRRASATFEVKLANWIKIIDARGEKMNRAETVTLLNDMCFMAPATLTDRRISWETVDSVTVKALFENEGIRVSALLYFNEQGALINFISNDRYHTDGKTYVSYPWETPVESYHMMNGYFLPQKAKLIYRKPEGPFVYGELEIKHVVYNLSNMSC